MSGPVLCTPLRGEHAALRGARRSLRLVRTGMGPRRAAATAATLGTDPVLVAGVGGGLVPQVRPGDVVVAREVRDGHDDASRVEVPSAPLLAGALRRLGLTVHLGPVSSLARIAWAPTASSRAHPGSLAVDLESAQLAAVDVPCAGVRVCAVVRVIVDTPDPPLWHAGTLRRGVSALRTLRACRPAVEWWAAATGPRELLLAAPVALASEVDLVLVAGSADSLRLVEGAPAHLGEDVSEIDLRWLAGTTRVGITAGAGAAPGLVEQIVRALGGLGPVRVAGTVALPSKR